MLIPHQSNVEKSTWRSHQYFVDFESGIHVEISTSNRCHNFHMDLPFKIEEISTNFPRRVSRSNRWQIYQPANSNISPLHHLAIICNFIGHDERLMMKAEGWFLYLLKHARPDNLGMCRSSTPFNFCSHLSQFFLNL